MEAKIVWLYDLFFKFVIDLVIDEEQFQNDVKDQLLPKKQKEVLTRIQVHQKYVSLKIDS